MALTGLELRSPHLCLCAGIKDSKILSTLPSTSVFKNDSLSSISIPMLPWQPLSCPLFQLKRLDEQSQALGGLCLLLLWSQVCCSKCSIHSRDFQLPESPPPFSDTTCSFHIDTQVSQTGEASRDLRTQPCLHHAGQQS